jgi:hypothetical protein
VVGAQVHDALLVVDLDPLLLGFDRLDELVQILLLKLQLSGCAANEPEADCLPVL